MNLKTEQGFSKTKKTNAERISETDVNAVRVVGVDSGRKYLFGMTAYALNKPASIETLAIKSSAVRRHTSNYTRWLKAWKEKNRDVYDLERQLTRRDDESHSEFAKRWFQAFVRLHGLYNTSAMKRRRWDARRNARAEMDRGHQAIFKSIGGNCSTGPAEGTIGYIALGDGGFDPKQGQHKRFEDLLQRKAESLGFRLAVVSEYNTSQKCPAGHQLEMVSMRIKRCEQCNVHFHRDKLAGENMCRILESSLRGLQRPNDLQPQVSHHVSYFVSKALTRQ